MTRIAPVLALFPLLAFAFNCGGNDAPSAVNLVPAFPGLPPLEQPVGLVEVPEHDLFLIVLLEGRVLAVPRNGLWNRPRTVHDQRARTVTEKDRGLLSLALDPDFARNGYVYAFSSFADKQNRLARYETTGAGETFAFDAASELPILEVTNRFRRHSGGALAFGADGMLWLSLGDGDPGDDRLDAQDRTLLPGSIVRIDVRGATAESPYRIPPDNPFVGKEGVRPEIWAWGFRNPWRMSIDRETGLVWTGDVGQNSTEEINIVREGGNHGWAFTEGSDCRRPGACNPGRFVAPVQEYEHDQGCAVIGGHVYRGDAIPALRGWYLYSDHCVGFIRALDADAAASGRPVEAALLDVGGDDLPSSVVSFAEDARGELYVISFDGRHIYRVEAP